MVESEFPVKNVSNGLLHRLAVNLTFGLVGIAVALLLLALLHSPRTYAYSEGPGLGNAPAPQYIIDQVYSECVAGWHIVQVNWLSSVVPPVGNSAGTSVTVNYGATSVPLELNFLAYRCANNSSTGGGVRINSIGPNGVSGITLPLVHNLVYPPQGWWTLDTSTTFNYDLSQSVQSGYIGVYVASQGTIDYNPKWPFPGQSWWCAITPGENQTWAGNEDNFNGVPPYSPPCPNNTEPFLIYVIVGPPPVISCNNLSTSPANPQSGQKFSVTGGFSLSGAAGSNFSYSISINIPNLYTGPAGSGTVVSGGTASATVGGLSANTGLYTGNPNAFTVNVTGVGSMGCPGSVTVSGQPYLRVYGGDVLAGSGFDTGSTTCTPDPNSSILAFNEGNVGGSGAGTQFAAQATGAIQQFSSALLRTSPPQPTGGLSFASSSGYGGSFGAGICAQDYYGNTSSIPLLNSSTYSNGAIADGQHLVIRYYGNLEINGNINYADTNWGCLTQSQCSSSIPSIYVIVQGNIYIDSNVTNLDGVYIAQPQPSDPNTTSTGRIYTCTSPGATFVAPASLATTCNNKLTINGAFIASQVRFLRTNGSLSQSSPGEASTSSNVAEVFNYDPELWLVNPELTNSSNSNYDSISSLPPVL